MTMTATYWSFLHSLVDFLTLVEKAWIHREGAKTGFRPMRLLFSGVSDTMAGFDKYH